MRDSNPLRGRAALLSALLAVSLLWGACERTSDTGRVPRAAVAITQDDECHVCGMIILRFAGPKGEAYVARLDQPLKFCSTRDLFAWLLQPETAAVVQEIYVHDMAQTDWSHPENAQFINARGAWYVVGSERTGAMGPTLASFATRKDARLFADAHGGRVLGFADITLEVLASLMSAPFAPPRAAPP